MPTQTLFKPRQYAGDADVPAICDLLNRCDAVDKLDDNYDVESLRVEFSSPNSIPRVTYASGKTSKAAWSASVRSGYPKKAM